MIISTGKGRARRGTGRWLGAAVAVALCAAPATPAAQHVLTWNGTSWDGDWKPGAGAAFPGNTATDTYSLLIDGGKAANSQVTLYGARTVDSVVVDAGDTLVLDRFPQLTLTTGLTVNGTVRGTATGPARVVLPAGPGLTGSGELFNVSVSNADGGMVIGSGVTVRVLSPTTGRYNTEVGTAGRPLSNEGHIIAEQGGVITLRGGTFINSGRIEAVDGGVVAFDVPLTGIAGLGQLSSAGGGRFRIANTLDNTGRTLALDNSTMDWELTGTMTGGGFTTADGEALYIPENGAAVLDGVSIGGDLRVGSDAGVEFRNRPTLTGGGRIFLEGDNAPRVYTTEASLVIGADLTVIGRSYGLYAWPSSSNGLGDVTRPTVNRGVLVADQRQGALQVNGSSFRNEGRIEISNGGVFAINAPFRPADLGTYTNNGSIRIVGTLENDGQTFRITPEMGAWELAGTIQGGTIETPTGKYLTIPDNHTGVLDGVRLNGKLRLGLPNPRFQEAAHLQIRGGQPLDWSGEILIASNYLSTITGEGGLTIGPGMTIHGAGGRVGDTTSPLVNYGLVSADVAPRFALNTIGVVGSSIQNLGTFEVKNGGMMEFWGSYTTAGLGRLVNNGGVMQFGGTLDNTGQVFEVNAATGPRQLVGTLRGGVLRTDADHPLVVNGGTFDGVILDGYVTAGGSVTFTGAPGGTGQIRFTGGSLKTTSAVDEIGAGIVVRSGAFVFQIGDLEKPLINHGEVWVDSGRLQMLGRVVNEGRLRLSKGEFRVGSGLRMGDGGVLSAVLGPDVSMYIDNGDLDLSGAGDRLDLVLGPGAILNSRYLVIQYEDRLVGTFDEVTPGFQVDYSMPGKIYVTAVPEPAGALGGLALVLSLAGRGRRRPSGN